MRIISFRLSVDEILLSRFMNWLTKLALQSLFCVAIERDSVFLLRFPFLSYIQVTSLFLKVFLQLFVSLFRFQNFVNLLIILWLPLLLLAISVRLSLLFFVYLLEILNWCFDAILNAGDSSSSFFFSHIESVYVIFRVHWHKLPCPLVHLSGFLQCPIL